jgi:perosamine synthetase
MPAISFVATANAASYLGATPHFLDAETETLGIDPVALENYLNNIADNDRGFTINKLTGKKISAIVPMHTFGHPVKINEVLYNLRIFKFF